MGYYGISAKSLAVIALLWLNFSTGSSAAEHNNSTHENNIKAIILHPISITNGFDGMPVSILVCESSECWAVYIYIYEIKKE